MYGTVRKLRAFSEFETEFIAKEICRAMLLDELRVNSQGMKYPSRADVQVLRLIDEIKNQVYIVLKGSVVVQTLDNQQVLLLSVGDSFGGFGSRNIVNSSGTTNYHDY